MRLPFTVVALAAFLSTGTLAAAQETGTVIGTIYDRTGAVVVGATVTISGAVMPAPRTTVTSDKGAFGFLVLPGDYQVDS